MRYTVQEVHPGEQKVTFRVRSLPNTERTETVIYYSRPGERYRTIMETFNGNETVPKRDQVLFSDCRNCKLVASLSTENRTECVLYSPASALSRPILHCHFLYDLFCGTAGKLNVSDQTCLRASSEHPAPSAVIAASLLIFAAYLS
ncbi:uncharacterized protein LOC119443850 [Dermacentor silvarum]|uniref:uncharacterized protein LOC119443850 n=1 Tax=Dermacentor silvarum TaxID=543639 RepID=UPI002101CBC9|nr:uncharacterized protein LOC119443850 [Dermacentor silvarum]